ncbi:Rv3654c family TadE-like protein [Corynebacterium meitnerae]|uniref:Flp pilus-assembly TadE/G-like family protein n=1 Tax=Corynebacterium meitnerae TaxID=2913498 RepID=A0A9X3RL55_9CORY|nr:flp pilus-assembly TadE/G-like family protein [Corynebacterium meitnerae]
MKRRLLIDDHGYATILSTTIVAAVVSLAVVVAGIVSHVVNSHRAQVAADLSAVTAATAFYAGHDPCEKARVAAELNHAKVLSCEVIDAGVTDTVVTVKVGRAEATARAGPI